MGMKEKELMARDFTALHPDSERMFRINAGRAWAGEVVSVRPGQKIEVYNNMMILKNARVFHGAPTGFPDTVGWKTVEITTEMVGKKLAIFVGVEYKATGKLSAAQKKFGQLLTKMGGIFRVIWD